MVCYRVLPSHCVHVRTLSCFPFSNDGIATTISLQTDAGVAFVCDVPVEPQFCCPDLPLAAQRALSALLRFTHPQDAHNEFRWRVLRLGSGWPLQAFLQFRLSASGVSGSHEVAPGWCIDSECETDLLSFIGKFRHCGTAIAAAYKRIAGLVDKRHWSIAGCCRLGVALLLLSRGQARSSLSEPFLSKLNLVFSGGLSVTTVVNNFLRLSVDDMHRDDARCTE